MDLILTNTDFNADGIFGTLTDSNGSIIAYTLQHAYEQPDSTYAPKLYNGTFICQRGEHRLEGMDHDFTTFEITGVEGHTDILFHSGNYNDDSAGCVLLGSERFGNMVTNSRNTFNNFMNLQDGIDQFTLTVQ